MIRLRRLLCRLLGHRRELGDICSRCGAPGNPTIAELFRRAQEAEALHRAHAREEHR